MCEKCFQKEFYSFPAYWDFDEFYSDFTRKISGLKRVSSDVSTADAYECQNCHIIWCLSFPDISWRGYFLKENSARFYLEELTQAQAKREEQLKKGCLIVVLVIVGVMLLLLTTYIAKKLHYFDE